MEHTNFSTLCFLVDQGVRAIAVTYEEIDLRKDTTKMKFSPEYLSNGRLPDGATIFKTFDNSIGVDDFVVVPTNTRHGMTVCKVVAVDVDIDYSDQSEVHWIVGTVDRHAFERVRQWEDEMIGQVKSAKVHDERRKLAEQLKGSLGDNIAAIPQFSKTADTTEQKGD